jgi:inhibitor of cysteine peptidase
MKQPKTAIVITVTAIVFAALILAITGCTVGDEVKEYRDPSAHILVEKGNEFAIILESNPTTGYQWRLEEPLDEDIITLEKTEYEEPESELLGAPGEEKWTFKAEGLGETTVSLAYVRPWEDELPGPTERIHVNEEDSATSEEETEEFSRKGDEAEEEKATTMTFQVKVVSQGSLDKEAKEYDDENAPIEVEEDLKFAIVLESNPTTGYSWQLAGPLDEDIVELVSTEYEKKSGGSEEGEGEDLGSSGEEIWTFLAVGEGETEIDFEYVRSWEEDVAPEEEKTFSVTVKAVEEEEGEE